MLSLQLAPRGVVKIQGDGFMLALPAIGAAAACMVSIQRSLRSAWEGAPVSVRMGMHYGNDKSEGGDFFGRTVVVAARRANAALGGEILVSQAVQEGPGSAFLFEGAVTTQRRLRHKSPVSPCRFTPCTVE